MGVDALRGNGVTTKALYFFRDDKLVPLHEPLRKVRRSRLLLFVVLELVGFGATFAIVQTIGRVSFILNTVEPVCLTNDDCQLPSGFL